MSLRVHGPLKGTIPDMVDTGTDIDGYTPAVGEGGLIRLITTNVGTSIIYNNDTSTELLNESNPIAQQYQTIAYMKVTAILIEFDDYTPFEGGAYIMFTDNTEATSTIVAQEITNNAGSMSWTPYTYAGDGGGNGALGFPGSVGDDGIWTYVNSIVQEAEIFHKFKISL